MTSFPPTFKSILDKGTQPRITRGDELLVSMLDKQQRQLNFGSNRRFSHLVSGTTNPSSTHAILVTAAPIFTTQAVDIPAPYVVANDSY